MIYKLAIISSNFLADFYLRNTHLCLGGDGSCVRVMYNICNYISYTEILLQSDNDLFCTVDNFFRARCNCGNDTTGDFCEDSVNLCYNNPCYEHVTCNSSITSGNPCGRCTDGLLGDGLKCYGQNIILQDLSYQNIPNFKIHVFVLACTSLYFFCKCIDISYRSNINQYQVLF